MKRASHPRLYLMGALLALALAAAVNLSCSKETSPLQPSSTAFGSRGGSSTGDPFHSGLPNVPTEALVTLVPDGSINDFVAANDMELVTSLTIPAAGEFGEETYHLVHSEDNRAIDLTRLPLDPLAATVSTHNRIWIPEDDRGDLPFDDQDSWRLATEYANQPAITQVKIPQARTVTEGYKKVIAIMDTGIDRLHPFFTSNNANIKPQGNFLTFPPITGTESTPDVGNGADEDQDGIIDDGKGHGTHVAGIAFTGARRSIFYIYKVLDAEGRGTAMGLAKAIKDAADKNVHVINLSLGLHEDNRMLRHVIAYAIGKGIAVVASAGNRASTESQYPAAYAGVIAVAAVANNDVIAGFSSYGPDVDISAPGVDVISPIPSGLEPNVEHKYAAGSGTSMAAPFVSAAIALAHTRFGLMSMTPAATAAAVLQGAEDVSAENPTFPGQLGSGRVDLYQPLVMPWVQIEE